MRDIDIRRALIARVQHQHSREKNTRVVEELSLCQGEARVDLAVINGKVHGYEIKSERDTLVRLNAQADVYNTALDKVTIVVADVHAEKATSAIPNWWGIIIALPGDQGITLKHVRRAKQNPDVNTYAQAQLLWRDEVLAELTKLKLHVGLTSKPKKELWRHLTSSLSGPAVRALVRERLKARSNWRVASPQA